MTTAVHPNIAKCCFICGGGFLRSPKTCMPRRRAPMRSIPSRFSNVVCADMSRRTSDRNIRRTWTRCTGLPTPCGWWQKNNISNGKVVSREKPLAKTLASLLDTKQGAVLDVGTGMGYLLAALAEELPEFISSAMT